MTREGLLELLEAIQRGETSPADAAARLSRLPYEDAGFAKIDHHRSLRLGLPHPITGKRLQLEAPLPPDLADALQRAGIQASPSLHLRG